MKLWPWAKKPEKRSYEALTLANAIAAADRPPVGALAAVEFCANTWARGLAAAEVSGTYSEAVSRDFMHRLGRELVTRGELVAVVSTASGEVVPRLMIPTDWNVEGTRSDPDSWRYEIYDGERSTSLRNADVLHIRLNVSTQRPWEGRSPLMLAESSRKALESTDLLIRDTYRYGSAVGMAVEVPGKLTQEEADSIGEAMVENFIGERGSKRGGMVVLPGGGKIHELNNMTPANAQTLELRQQLSEDLCRVCGIPIELMHVSQGPADREAMKSFVFATLAPVARVIESELHRKLSDTIRLDFSELRASDLQARTRGYAALVQAGMAPEQAARIAGFEPEAVEGAIRPMNMINPAGGGNGATPDERG